MFEAGDKVKLKENCSGNIAGKIYFLTKHEGLLWAGWHIETPISGCSCPNNWELIRDEVIYE